jgi:zinc and cadmium transporter
LFSLIGGLLSVILAASFLLIGENSRQRKLPHLGSFAICSLLGATFLGLIPHALDHQYAVDTHDIGLTLLIGLLVFFILQKTVLWRHCHQEHCDAHLPTEEHDHHSLSHEHGQQKATVALVLVGETIHYFVDGVLITAAFLTDSHLGIVTAIAIAAHEIPQELGDFVILLNNGFSRSKALYYNILSALGTVFGAVLAYFMLVELQHLLPYVLAVAAASFIYVAVADLIPGLHKHVKPIETAQQVLLIVLGVMVIFLTHSTLH